MRKAFGIILIPVLVFLISACGIPSADENTSGDSQEQQAEIRNALVAAQKENQRLRAEVGDLTGQAQAANLYWEALRDTFDLLDTHPGAYPFRDPDMTAGEADRYGAVVSYFDAIRAQNQDDGAEDIYALLKVEEYTRQFAEMYGHTEYYDPDYFYYKAYEMTIRRYEDGSAEFALGAPICITELAVYRSESSTWEVSPARG